MINFQDMIAKLIHFWAEQGCLVHQGYDLEVGAGTFNPATFLRCLGPEPYSAVYVEPSRRPQDGRYGENPNRVQFYHQMQVILKPSPSNIQDLYLKSLESIGLNLNQHDIRFVHDDWENPTIGAWGLGWEVWADGMEVTQFTYFQAVGGIPVKPVSGELTYGLERLAMYIQGVDSIFDLNWNDGITYGDIFKRSEWEWSHYNFEQADTTLWLRHFEDFEREAKRMIEQHFPIPAYDFIMKASHAFNILDARGVISVTERTGYIARIRALAKMLAESYIESREKLQFPLLRQKNEKEKPKAPSLTQKGSTEEKCDFLLEIGSEELPALFVPIGMRNLENQMRTLLKEHSLSFEKIETFGTPRRLAILVKGLAGGTPSKKVQRKGPSLKAAFDGEGHITKAGKGFLQSVNLDTISLDQIKKGAHPTLEIVTIRDTEYLFATTEIQETMTRELLATQLPKLILSIDFPKKMRWSDLEIEYARPLKWLVALYGEEVIPFGLAHLLSSNISYGHRQLAAEEIFLSQPKEYVQLLKNHWVMVDVKERLESIEEQLKKIEQNLKATAVAKQRVMPQVLHLVEWPFLTVAHFDSQFLQAPKEVLISEMVEHQKYFPVANEEGTLMPYFVIVCNNKPTDLIRKGNQKALSPRLADGMFLYEEDLKIPLERFNEKLKTMTFQKELGSVWNKVERISSLVKMLHTNLPICDLSLILRAATLCKADLASELVGEFPELQGVVGRLYALKQGEKPEVAFAIDEHWMPRGEKAPLPKTPYGVILSLAEKIDNLICCFALDLKPTSSSDPYALRRQGIGMLKMIIEGKYALSLPKIFQEGYALFLQDPGLKKFKGKEKSVLTEINEFLLNRLRSVLLEYGFEKDEIEAILACGLNDCYATYKKIKALQAFRKTHHSQFLAILEIYMRAKKILLSQNQKSFLSVNPILFQDESEKALFDKLQHLKAKSFSTLEEHFFALAELQHPVNVLFEKVKIIDDDVKIRANRLGLLQEVWSLCEELLDFSKIQEHSIS